ncbi:MAG: hypothetical protein K6B65_03335 [Bacilli bacterium]|nr:hypothetical protein [Bacilli bacterium]
MKNLAVIGKPSDWLIASSVDYDEAKKFGVNIIDVDIKELEEASLAHIEEPLPGDFPPSFNKEETRKAYQIYMGLKDLVSKYDLSGLTVRCFDLLSSLKSTSCLGFALLNAEGIIATCEGDVPSMLSMFLVRETLNKSAFQANPSRIQTDTGEVIFAHCTLPLDMCSSYSFMTHYESGIGIGVRGRLMERKILIFRMDRYLKRFVLLSGDIEQNLALENLCRSQIQVKVDGDVTYFLKRPLGNHHIIVYGERKEAETLSNRLKELGLERVS